MGQLIDEEDCEVCEPFDQDWIFTYGDLVTLLLCFFVLLFSMCKLDIEKFKDVANSFKPTPAGSPYVMEGKDAIIEQIAEQVENSELSEETTVNVDARGAVVNFSAQTFFEHDSVELKEKAQEELKKFAKLLYLWPNPVQVEGHTSNAPTENYPSNWELSGARAARVARFLINEGVESSRITIKGFGEQRPRVSNETAEQRALNDRVEVVILPKPES